MSQGGWQTEAGSSVHNQVIGIPGQGKIGKHFACCAAVSGCRFRYGDIHLPSKRRELKDGMFLRVANNSSP